jgi:ATP-dependent Clp protease adaptor protein ClpS
MAGEDMTEQQRRPDIETVEKPARKAERPDRYKVILHNDDYTTMDFVMEVLEGIFQKGPAQAYRIMMGVHQTGRGVAGVYPHEVAETKVENVHDMARAHGYPLRASLEDD